MESTITCPVCGHQAVEIMLINACQIFYDCEGIVTLRCFTSKYVEISKPVASNFNGLAVWPDGKLISTLPM
jgi:hypothetical protein